ncbi:MAG: hypothetical protein WC405_17055 [Syntrophales bacterium]
MKINVTKDEYRSLIDIIYIADWVLTSYKSEEGQEIKRYKDVMQKFYALAKDMGMENLIKFDKELNAYWETKEFDDTSECHQFIDEYDNDSFWERLIEQLTTRDLEEELGGKKTMDKDPDKYFERYAAIEMKYMAEFEENGLDNLTIRKRKPALTN